MKGNKGRRGKGRSDIGKIQFFSVFRIRIRTDPHKEMAPGSGSAWTDADPDSGGKKA